MALLPIFPSLFPLLIAYLFGHYWLPTGVPHDEGDGSDDGDGAEFSDGGGGAFDNPIPPPASPDAPATIVYIPDHSRPHFPTKEFRYDLTSMFSLQELYDMVEDRIGPPPPHGYYRYSYFGVGNFDNRVIIVNDQEWNCRKGGLTFIEVEPIYILKLWWQQGFNRVLVDNGFHLDTRGDFEDLKQQVGEVLEGRSYIEPGSLFEQKCFNGDGAEIRDDYEHVDSYFPIFYYSIREEIRDLVASPMQVP